MPLRDAYELTTSGVGMALSAVGLGIAVSELPWGMLTDRIGDRRVLLSGLCLTSAVLMWMAAYASPSAGHAPSLALLVTCMALLGMAGGSVNGSSGRAVMTWFSNAERGLAMSIRQTALPVGGSIGALTVPALAQGSGFRAAYAVLALSCVAAAALCARYVREPGAPMAPSPMGAVAAGATPLRRWQVWRIVWAIGVLCVAQIAVLSFMAVFLHDVAGVGLAGTSAAMAGYQVGAALLRVGSGAWTDRRGNRLAFLRHCCLLTATIFGALALQVAVSGPSWGLLATLVAGGMAASCWHGVAFTELAIRAGADHVGTALGMGNTLAFSSYFLTPLMVPLALSNAGWVGGWGLVAACSLLALPFFPRR